MTKPSLTSDQLAELWRCDNKLLLVARKAGKLVALGNATYPRYPLRYSYDVIDGMHRRGLSPKQSHTKKLPSVASMVYYQLTKNEPALLTTAEVGKRLGLASQTVYDLVERGELIAFQPLGSGRWLYPTTLVAEYLQQRPRLTFIDDDDVVTRDYAAMVTGLSVWSLRDYYDLADCPLVGGVTRQNVVRPVISRRSLMAYLKEYLAKGTDGAPHMSPEAWCAMREKHSTEPLLTKYRVMKLYGMGDKTVARAIVNGTLPCLWTPGFAARIPQHAAEAWSECR